VPGLVLAFGYLSISLWFRQKFGERTPAFLDVQRWPVLLLILAYAARRLPYIVRSAVAGLEQTPRDLELAASNLGVMTGQIQLGFPSFTSSYPSVKAGKLKALAITTKKRSALAPDIPTMDESGLPGYDASIWNGVLVPAGTPKAIVNRLHDTIVQILKTPQAAERYANVGADIRYNTPEEFTRILHTDYKKWGDVVRQAGIRVDQR
jgi:hypothetical protein